MSHQDTLGMFQRLTLEIDGIEHQIPSDPMLLEVLQFIPLCDYSVFLKRSNRFVSDFEMSVSHETAQRGFFIWIKICELTGFSFLTFLKADTEMGWYTCVDTGGSSPRKNYDQMAEFSQISESVLIHGHPPVELQAMQESVLNGLDEDRASRFKHFNLACDVIDFLIHLADSRSEEEPTLRFWLNALVQNQLEIDRQILSNGMFLEEHWTFCPFCGKEITYSLKPGRHGQPKTCGSTECDRKYEAAKKRHQRGSAQLQNGWKSGFDKRKQRCKECKKVRQVSDLRICKDCFEGQIAQR